MLEIKSLSKSFDDYLALKDINLKFEENKIYGLIGINGAGKSTLFRTIAGIYKPEQGDALFEDISIYENEEAKKNIFYIPDENPYFNVKTINELIGFYSAIYGPKDEEIFNKLKGLFTIDINAPLSSYSKGMKKQGYLFATLCFKPKLLLLDETFEGIDPVIRVKIKKMLIEYVEDENVTVIISSHNINDLDSLCDEIIMLKDKEVFEKAFEKKDELFKIQCAFKNELIFDSTDKIKILKITKLGSVYHFEVSGEMSNIKEYFSKKDPIIFDIIPFSTEEIFIFNAEEGTYE